MITIRIAGETFEPGREQSAPSKFLKGATLFIFTSYDTCKIIVTDKQIIIED